LPSLDECTENLFAPHTEVFHDCAYTIKPAAEGASSPTLSVKKGKKSLTAFPFTNLVKLGKKDIRLSSVIVYVDKTATFYLPRELRSQLD
ncbi:MAG: alkaline phosphatase, partial [Tannerellaceae bacterium]|nr:alkaline phosphatase [Tannerellaceae bacterium]